MGPFARSLMPNSAGLALLPGEDIEARGYFEKAFELFKRADARAIYTTEDLTGATEDLSLIAKLKKQMDAKRKEYLAPLKTQSDAIRATYEYLMTPIRQADDLIRKKILSHNAEQARIRREQEEINRKRTEAAEAEMKLKGELSEPVNLVEVSPEAPGLVRTGAGTAGQRDNWKYEVTDFAALPDEYKVADTAMLNAIAKRQHDNKQVPGVRFYNEPIISVRAN